MIIFFRARFTEMLVGAVSDQMFETNIYPWFVVHLEDCCFRAEVPPLLIQALMN